MLFNEADVDLLGSGLAPEDLQARKASLPELSACGLEPNSLGYVIPYYYLTGKPAPFYRIKLFGKSFKYMQPKNTTNHVYFPKTLLAALHSPDYLRTIRADEQKKYILIVEGEKKAACAVKNGFPAVALGGVDSWKNKTLILPANTDLSKTQHKNSMIAAKLPTGELDPQEANETILAHGFLEMIDYAIDNDIHLIVCFDTDEFGVKMEVQRAAAALGFELRYRGVPFQNIHQLTLPSIPGEKVGLDDFLTSPNGVERFNKLITATFKRTYSFPTHPNAREYVNRKLQKTKLSRKESQQIAISILSDLDANGTRLRSKEEDQMYYFDNRTRKLMKVFFNMNQSSIMHGTAFGQLLYNNYGVSSADARILTWLDIQFNSELPIEEVTPNRVIGIQKVSRVKDLESALVINKNNPSNNNIPPMRAEPNRHAVRYQINDGQYVRVSADPTNPVAILDNGTDGYMFLSEQVEPVDAARLMEALESQRKKPLTPWWMNVLDDVRLKENKDDNQSKLILMLHYYISPWLNKWMGLQMPVELVIGEAGSGKSSLYEHRLNILTGNPVLRNAPPDLKDWHASVTNTGGLHVTDNVQLLNKDLRQKLSDELCRVVTEPDPHVEMRKLYSNNELIRTPIHATFAITAIQQPFQNADLIQRSIKIELDKNQVQGDVEYDSNWVYNQMAKFGGRTQWIAHHLLVLEAFFRIGAKEWDTKYRSLHRLIHFEQSLRTMAKVFGLEDEWIPKYLAGATETNIAKTDTAVEGLVAFGQHCLNTIELAKIDKYRFTVSDIVTWAEDHEEYKDNPVLTNVRSLGRYIQSNKHLVRTITKIEEFGSRHNKMVYHFNGLQPLPKE